MKIPHCTSDCPNRSIEPNCHTTCQIYLDWRANKDKENAARRSQGFEIEYIREAQNRMRRARYHGCKQE